MMLRFAPIVATLWFLVCLIVGAPSTHPIWADDSVRAELEAFKPLGGLAVNLFASEEDGIVNPLQMRWDSRGRLFVVCSLVYPQLEPGGRPNDYIRVLEDSDGDGRADRSSVFAEGLNIPTGLEISAGDVYVGQGTEILVLRDRDGDGRADERHVLLSGFGNGDSHQTINSFVWSPGGELWFCQGDGIESRVETPWGIASLYQAGVWRLRPKRLQLGGLLDDFMGPGNPWGIGFDDWGQVIVVDGAGGISYMTPAMIPTSHRLKLPRIGKPGGYCGVEFLDGGHLGDAFREEFVLGDYHRSRVGRFVLEDDGAGFRVAWKSPLLESRHKKFRPVDVRMGPDGAIYVADWYNPLICHQEVEYRHPERDKTHGRIWRVSAEGKEPVNAPRLAGVSAAKLVRALASPERWTRQQAKQQLASKDRADAARELGIWWRGLPIDSPEYERHLVTALGAYATIESVAPELLDRVLGCEEPRARAYAARMTGRWGDRLENPLARLRRAIADSSPRVRLEAVVACAHIPSEHAVEVAARVVDAPRDGFIDYAFTQAVHHLVPLWLPAFRAGRLRFGESSARRAAVLGKVRSSELTSEFRSMARSATLDAPARVSALHGLIALSDPDDLRLALERSTYERGGDYEHQMHSDILGELARVARSRTGERSVRPSGDLAAMLRSLVSAAREVVEIQPSSLFVARVHDLIGIWGVESLIPELVRAAENAGSQPSARISAVVALGAFESPVARRLVESIARDDDAPAELRVAAACAVAGFDVEGAAELAVKLLAPSPPTIQLAELIVAGLGGRNGGAAALAAAIERATLSRDAAKVMLRALNASGRAHPALVMALAEASGIDAGEPAFSVAHVKELVMTAKTRGDATRGKALFRSEVAACSRCHKIDEVGGWIGPDLSAIGTTIPPERIVEEVVWPARQVKEGFTLTSLVLVDGAVLQGYLKERKHDEDAIHVQDLADGEIVRVSKSRLLDRADAGSAMPAGVAAGLTRAELADLLRYLFELGSAR